MAQTKNKRKGKPAAKSSGKTTSRQTAAPRRRDKTHAREAGAIFCLVLGVFSIISYFSASGVFIGFFSSLLKGLLGWGYYTVPPLLIFCAVILGFHRGRPVRFRVTCTLLLSVSVAALLHLLISRISYEVSFPMFKELWLNGTALHSGGVLGGALSEIFTYLFSKIGAAVVLICSSVFFLLAALNKTIAGLIDAYRNRERYAPEPEPERVPAPARAAAPARETPIGRSQPEMVRFGGRVIDIPLDEPQVSGDPEPLKVKKHTAFFNTHPRVKTPDEVLAGDAQEKPEVKADSVPAETAARDVPLDIPFPEKKPAPEKKQEAVPPEAPKPPAKTEPEKPEPEKTGTSYVYPTMDLLSTNTAGRVDGSEEVRLNIERLEAAFKSFGVNVKIISYTRGPTVTRYEAELEAGVKLNRLTSLADDIALSLGANGVRIAAMPNKISTVGIEVPNKLISKVLLRDIIDSPEFKNASSKLTFAIGKNIGGEAIVGNISKLPHMLVAGTTGSGKSVCLNSLILSILYKSTPEEVRFIMIDPKMVEFRVYNGIPHLLVPVVTDVKKAAGALQWAVVEMMKRYRTFSEANARDLESYNKLMKNSEEEGAATLPQIVVVIDELADLMLTAAKEVEESICRVAQMGRAAGVHLIIATQSPRADVITGLMKANIPSRIALKVSSALESRIILDAGGNADKLVGNGDMLYAPIGVNKPIRIQGTWVSDSEREKVVEFVKKSGDAQYNEEVIHQIDKAAEEKSSNGKKEEPEEGGDDYDELLPQAVEIIFETGQASVSMLQRRLKLGYSRAARIVDQMEQRGIVGPFEGSKPRQMLINRSQWHEMQFVQGTAPIGDPEVEVEEASETEDAPF
ncbi:DNA segregation ATPase FtsK/SpoIIIE, S-DNA-T family [Sporobacter termitidis DSM 10068]|uniref:DNA segregation ATPase FtsK/SpoIIIE, S-DNA-T family n=1 Tax=Sporobacter termitidis DSM 10068 TaxID=1123282 RepID=A0A1M5WU66_9FIRM|nr:DNA translocase FtsK [Sporobacter termitidis]SHH91195.1 DNA segregation ATPase FtsK/SpoIIIE, S-DNA-T family [Sporobacter termitidis DSM 10068]